LRERKNIPKAGQVRGPVWENRSVPVPPGFTEAGAGSPSRGAPPRAWSLAEWALLPLRAFLGGTFLFAGVQKLSNPNFFDRSSPISIQAQLAGSARISPVGGLLTPLEHVAVLVGLLIALGEVAVGVGTLLGMWTRVAAVGGALLSLMLFLTVSFHDSPYFTGADIVFLFAWTPLVLSGGGTRLSLDARNAKRVARERGLASPELVSIPFATVQGICGHFDGGACDAQGGAACRPSGCPVLSGPSPLVARGAASAVARRTVVIGASRAAVVAAGTVVVVGVVAGTARSLASTKDGPTSKHLSPPTTTTSPTGPTTTSPGTLIGTTSELPAMTSASFTCPNGDPGLAICPSTGDYVAYDAVCPHAGCTVGYFASANLIVCPCHGSEFEVATGSVVQGPATRGLTPLTVINDGGDLYIT
jgi:thiosulfate dehydrogenase (quinone) large subunit